MSYEIVMHDQATQLRFLGDVYAIDLIELHQDPRFVENLSDHRTLIYDYSFADRICFQAEDVDSFALLANVESNFISDVHIIIVPFDPNNKTRINRYLEVVHAEGWKVSVADTFTQALAMTKG
jgi:hypothetical protein